MEVFFVIPRYARNDKIVDDFFSIPEKVGRFKKILKFPLKIVCTAGLTILRGNLSI
jgi:hypothetical protein